MASRFMGYTGKVLDVDLSTGKIGEYDVSDEDRELFLGGRFLASKILWDILPPGVDPLGPENVLVVMTGPLTGTGAPSSSRTNLSAKSPATGAIGHSNSGGNLGIRLKRAGWDGMLVRGAAKAPVYIEVAGEKVSIKSAEKLWGMDTEEAQEALGEGGTLVIGPAGENLVPFASAVSQERSHGRTGMGAVMGSKNLKGIVARGNKKVPVREPEAFKKTVKAWVKMLKEHPSTGGTLPKYGTAFFVNILSKNNALPTRNFQKGSWEKADLISGERLADEYMTANTGCVSCPIRCGRQVVVDGKKVKGPEFETLCLLGSNILVDDLKQINAWNRRLDLLGLDSISTGNVLGFAAELSEKGLWESGLTFGDVDAFSQAIEDLAHGRGIGKDLALGVRGLSRKYGGEDFAAHVKGLEIPAYEPRSSVGHGLGYAVAGRGACHLDGGYLIYFEVSGPATLNARHLRSKPAWAVFAQNLMGAISAGGNCLFSSWTALPPFLYAMEDNKPWSVTVEKLLTAAWPVMDKVVPKADRLFRVNLPILPHTKAIQQVTGMPMDLGRFMAIGERGYALDRLLNHREGIGPESDTLPRRFTKEPLVPGDPTSVVNLSAMVPKYYKLRGWDQNGLPTPKTLQHLKMNFATA